MISVGTKAIGTTIRDRTGALRTLSVAASRTAFSVGGRTSQKDRVKSKGVWAMAQKFAYLLGLLEASSGTMVKLIGLRSFMA